MNWNLLQGKINEYKNDFARINNLEIYKWQAVKQFQQSSGYKLREFCRNVVLVAFKNE